MQTPLDAARFQSIALPFRGLEPMRSFGDSVRQSTLLPIRLVVSADCVAQTRDVNSETSPVNSRRDTFSSSVLGVVDFVLGQTSSVVVSSGEEVPGQVVCGALIKKQSFSARFLKSCLN